jgi:hypothetical protein
MKPSTPFTIKVHSFQGNVRRYFAAAFLCAEPHIQATAHIAP